MTLIDATANPVNCAKISPTAMFVAYYRQFSDIPFATEIAKTLNVEEVTRQIMGDSSFVEKFMRRGAPAMEARYKSMISAIKKRGIKQVLEFASGLSFRGLWMTEDPAMVYVETDLDGIMQDKLKVIEAIPAIREQASRDNIFFHTVDALNFEDIELALAHFDPSKPVAVIHEGLYQYLSMDEKKALALNIKKILQRFGGAWITPDLSSKEDSQSWYRSLHTKEEAEAISKAIFKVTQRDFDDRTFEDNAQMESFFARLGFDWDVSSQIDGSYEMTAAQRFELTEEEISGLTESLKLWTLTLI